MPGLRLTDLHLDWEERLFRGLRALWRGFRPEGVEQSGHIAQLGSLVPRLEGIASLVAGRPLKVLPCRGAGGLRGEELLFPERMDLAPASRADAAEVNAALFVLRAVLAGAMLREEGPLPARREAAVARLREELPALGRAWEEALALQAAAGRVVLWGELFEPPRAPEGAGGGGDEATAREAREAEARAAERIEVLELAEEEPRPLPIHAFEKVETAEPFSGALRNLDGEDDLSDHLEALDEVDLGHLIRGGPQAHSLLRAEIALEAEVPEVGDIGPDEPGIAYPEWDLRRQAYRPDWTRVYPARAQAADPAWTRAARGRQRATVERLLVEQVRQRERLSAQPRQLDGEEIDLDALTDAWAARCAGQAPDPRLYVRSARLRPDRATLLLMDISLSADAWVEDRRVLDVARESALVLGEVAQRLGERLQIQAFASHTRHKVRCLMIRDWHEPWSLARDRLGALHPQGYTRIGPALRHATASLSRVRARRRRLLLLTDGKPTDYDRYEGRYGMADVRQALREARAAGVEVHALAIDRRAREGLPAMFGPGGWTILPRPETLPIALGRAFALER